MSEIDDKPSIADLTEPGEPSSEPGYLAWKEAKIRKAREDALRNPDKLVSHAEMRKRFGL